MRLSPILVCICITSATFLMGSTGSRANEIAIPGFTAYANAEKPDILDNLNWRQKTRFSEDIGISNWRGQAESISWFGLFRNTGKIRCHIEVTPQSDEPLTWEISGVGTTRKVSLPGMSRGVTRTVDCGEFHISKPGYVEFRLRSENAGTADNGQIRQLLLADSDEASALEDVHFNLKPRKNAASVHLFYPVEKDMEVEAFYCEMTGLEDPVWSYYMACGWHRGYFGMQVNSETERRIIFSVWDSGNEAIDRNKVADDNRVKLVAKGDDVHTNDFGNEGTGGHSHLKYMWKTGEVQKFLVTARPVEGARTIFSGYYYHPGKNEWMLISSWNAPKDGGYLRGLYSFSENFVGNNGHIFRKALYGNQWIKSADGHWTELTTARFSHDVTGRNDRLDRFMGVEDGQFFLAHGGFRDGFTKFHATFDRPATGQPPVISLPGITTD